MLFFFFRHDPGVVLESRRFQDFLYQRRCWIREWLPAGVGRHCVKLQFVFVDFRQCFRRGLRRLVRLAKWNWCSLLRFGIHRGSDRGGLKRKPFPNLFAALLG